MTWNLPIARIAGTEVRIHLTFLALLAWIGLASLFANGALAAIYGVTFVVLLFGCVLAHEFGHALAARYFGVPTPTITLYPIGGVARLAGPIERPAQELIVAIAGPAVNVVIAGALITLIGARAAFGGVDLIADSGGSLLASLAAANIWLVLFNLLPAFPMDGGPVLRAGLALWLPYERATRFAVRVGRAMALLFAIVGLFVNPLLTVIAVFIFFAGAQEAALAERRAEENRALHRAVRMDSPFETDPLSGYLRRTRRGSGALAPILDESGRVIGWTEEADFEPPRTAFRRPW